MNTTILSHQAGSISPGQVLSIHSTSEYIDLCRAQIYKLIKADDFAPAVRLSVRRIGFRVCDLDAWIESRMTA